MSASNFERTRAAIAETRKAYWNALGRFVDDFAFTEGLLIYALQKLIGISEQTAAALFSGTRVDAALSFLTRVADQSEMPERERRELSDARQQLGAITKMRNDLLHYGAYPDPFNPSVMYFQNSRSAHSKESYRSYDFPVKILEDMTFDLEKIRVYILMAISWQDERTAKNRELDADFLASAWRYTPPRLNQSRRKTRDKR